MATSTSRYRERTLGLVVGLCLFGVQQLGADVLRWSIDGPLVGIPTVAASMRRLTKPTVLAQAVPRCATMVLPDEPGDPLILSGTVYGPDGRTPVDGARLRIYHTDAAGLYSHDRPDASQPRLQCVLTTDASGRFEVRTIVPGAYPGQQTTAAHVHMMVSVGGGAEQNATFSLAGDSRLSSSDYEKLGQAGTFSAIRPIERGADGIFRCVRDIRLR
jgi:hypothetical protein